MSTIYIESFIYNCKGFVNCQSFSLGKSFQNNKYRLIYFFVSLGNYLLHVVVDQNKTF